MHVHKHCILTITVYLYLHVQLQRQNDREAKSIDSIFAEKQEKVELIRELEREIDEEKRAAEHVVGSMENEMLEKYHTLKAENTRIEKVYTNLCIMCNLHVHMYILSIDVRWYVHVHVVVIRDLTCSWGA